CVVVRGGQYLWITRARRIDLDRIVMNVEGDLRLPEGGKASSEDAAEQHHHRGHAEQHRTETIQTEAPLRAIAAAQAPLHLHAGLLVRLTHTVPGTCARCTARTHSAPGSPRTASGPARRPSASWDCRIPGRRSAE